MATKKAKCPRCIHSLSGYHLAYNGDEKPWNGGPESKNLWCGICKSNGKDAWCIIDGEVQK